MPKGKAVSEKNNQWPTDSCADMHAVHSTATLRDKATRCKRCPITMVFARNEDTGNMIPVDITSTVYMVFLRPNGEVTCRPLKWAGQPMATGVSHYVTCPHANEFSKGKRGVK